VQGVAFFHTAGARQVRGRQSKIARVPTTHDSAKHNKLFSIMLKTLLIAIFSFLALVTVRSRRKVMESIYKELYEAEPDAFNASASNYFAQQSNTTRPACIVRPETVKQLSLAVAILHQEFLARRADAHDKHNNLGFVSLRSGGHSYARASASIDGGVLLDLSRFSDVTISEDESSVTVGTGARWSKVNQVLEAKKIAVPGGRNAAVGVGGFTLGGKLCFKVRLGLLSQYTDTKLHRRYFILLTEIWISLLERHQVRGSIGFWTGGHCFRNKQPRTLACA
jgi:hypothetical protein